MTKHLLTFFLAIFLTSCDSLVTNLDPDDIPNTEAKLVIGCFLSPDDDFIRVKVLTTVPVFGQINLETTRGIGEVVTVDSMKVYKPANEDITNAIVKLSTDNQQVTLQFDKTQGVYRTASKDFRIEAGKTYKLNVEAPDGRKVSAECTVPEPIVVSSVKLDSIIARGSILKGTDMVDAQGFAKTVDANWQDPVGRKNFYEVSGFYEYTNLFEERNEVKIINQTNLITFGNQGGRGFFIDDTGLDGEQLTQKKGVYIPFGSIGFNNRDGSRKWLSSTVTRAVINLAHVDENYSKYRLSVYAARSQNFFTEPSLIYSNIKGGFGCFGAFNVTRREFYVKK
jgi:hypothetical protein